MGSRVRADVVANVADLVAANGYLFDFNRPAAAIVATAVTHDVRTLGCTATRAG